MKYLILITLIVLICKLTNAELNISHNNSTINYTFMINNTNTTNTTFNINNTVINSSIINFSNSSEVLNNTKNNQNNTSYTNSSIINIDEIVDVDSIKFGNSFLVKLNIYKNNTRKKLVQSFVNNVDNAKVSKVSKVYIDSYNTHNVFSIPIQLKQNCNNKFVFGEYYLVVEGLGLYAKMPLTILANEEDVCEEKNTKADTTKENPKTIDKISYDFFSPKNVGANKSFSIKGIINNPTEKDFTAEVWSFVYYYSKCISGERKGNKKSINIPKYSNITFFLENKVFAKNGSYKIKLNILRNDLQNPIQRINQIQVIHNNSKKFITEEKTKHHLNNSIPFVKEKKEISIAGAKNNTHKNKNQKKLVIIREKQNISEKLPESRLIYQSKSVKSANYILYFLVLVQVVVITVLAVKRL